MSCGNFCVVPVHNGIRWGASSSVSVMLMLIVLILLLFVLLLVLLFVLLLDVLFCLLVCVVVLVEIPRFFVSWNCSHKSNEVWEPSVETFDLGNPDRTLFQFVPTAACGTMFGMIARLDIVVDTDSIFLSSPISIKVAVFCIYCVPVEFYRYQFHQTLPYTQREGHAHRIGVDSDVTPSVNT